MKPLTCIGIGVSALWVIAFVAVIVLLRQETLHMGLNEWGDFFAGFSAPLALLWLVIGYFQQGEELRLNTKALEAQEEALRRQVEETHVLARSSERQALAAENLALLSKTEQEQQAIRERLEAEPKLIPAGGSRSGPKHEWHIINAGGDISDGKFEFKEDFDGINCSVPRIWKREGKTSIRIQAGSKPISYPLQFTLQYKDKLGNVNTKYFEYVKDNEIRELGRDLDGHPHE